MSRNQNPKKNGSSNSSTRTIQVRADTYSVETLYAGVYRLTDQQARPMVCKGGIEFRKGGKMTARIRRSGNATIYDITKNDPGFVDVPTFQVVDRTGATTTHGGGARGVVLRQLTVKELHDMGMEEMRCNIDRMYEPIADSFATQDEMEKGGAFYDVIDPPQSEQVGSVFFMEGNPGLGVLTGMTPNGVSGTLSWTAQQTDNLREATASYAPTPTKPTTTDRRRPRKADKREHAAKTAPPSLIFTRKAAKASRASSTSLQHCYL